MGPRHTEGNTTSSIMTPSRISEENLASFSRPMGDLEAPPSDDEVPSYSIYSVTSNPPYETSDETEEEITFSRQNEEDTRIRVEDMESLSRNTEIGWQNNSTIESSVSE